MELFVSNKQFQNLTKLFFPVKSFCNLNIRSSLIYFHSSIFVFQACKISMATLCSSTRKIDFITHTNLLYLNLRINSSLVIFKVTNTAASCCCHTINYMGQTNGRKSCYTQAMYDTKGNRNYWISSNSKKTSTTFPSAFFLQANIIFDIDVL